MRAVRSGMGRNQFLFLAVAGLALMVLGLVMPSTARAIRALSTPVLILGGFAAGYAIARLRDFRA